MKPQDLTRCFKALGDPTRLSVFDMLMEGVQCNCEISERLGLSLSLISHHTRILLEAGLITRERDPNDARWVYYSVDEKAVVALTREIVRLLDPDRIQPRQPSCGPKQCASP
jgi:ArsR family transcriptional regulator